MGAAVVVIGAGTQEVDGEYKMSGPGKEYRQVAGHHRIYYFPEKDGYAGGWYLDSVQNYWRALYYAPGDELLIPVKGWQVYTGPYSNPGAQPAPQVSLLDLPPSSFSPPPSRLPPRSGAAPPSFIHPPSSRLPHRSQPLIRPPSPFTLRSRIPSHSTQRAAGLNVPPPQPPAAATPDALFNLLISGQREEAKALVTRNRNLVHGQVEAGHSLLHEAALYGGADMVEWLLGHGASVRVKNRDQKTPVDVCQCPSIMQKFDDWVVVYGSGAVAPELDGKVSASCQVCFDDGHLGLGPDDFFKLPCGHMVHKPCMKQHIESMMNDKARLLTNLSCQHVGSGQAGKCGFNLNDIEHVRYFRHILSRELLGKLQTYLATESSCVAECPSCGEGVYMSPDAGDVHFRELLCSCGREFCGRCINGPHKGKTCGEAAEAAVGQDNDSAERNQVVCDLFKQGLFKPCPMRCIHLGFMKVDAADSCDHVTCPCGVHFCWQCGVDRRIILAHDNSYHKPSCKHHHPTKEPAKRERNCPACQETPGNGPCNPPGNDGWPEAYLPQVHNRGFTALEALLKRSQADLGTLLQGTQQGNPQLVCLLVLLALVLAWIEGIL